MSKFMYLKISKFAGINILFFPLLIMSFIFDYYIPFLLSYMCALIHEFSHIAFALILKVGISRMDILPFGVCARLKDGIIKNPVKEIVIALAGPLSNLLFAAVFYLLSEKIGLKSSHITYLIYCNSALAVVNLIPSLPLDGGRILRAALSLKIGSLMAYSLMIKISRIIIFILLLSAVLCVIFLSFNFSFTLIGVFLLGNLSGEQAGLTKTSLLEIMHYKEKLKDNRLQKSVCLTAPQNTRASAIFRKLSYDKYHIIFVTDKELKITKTLTEGQLMEALTHKSIRITLGEI